MVTEPDDYAARFGALARLFSNAGLERLRQAHVCVVGIGGVGSWTVEALARSGLGALTLVDLDDVCLSNTNRQLPATDPDLGRPKVEVMAQRVRSIHPAADVRPVPAFFTAANAAEILAPAYDWIVDAIDDVANKCLLIATARGLNRPILSTGGAGGRTDPTAIRVADLALSTHDALLQAVRKKLRRDHGFPRERTARFGVPCVFSLEPPVDPRLRCTSNGPSAGADEPLRLDCNSGYGSASFVTGAFGLAAAAAVVTRIARASEGVSPGYG